MADPVFTLTLLGTICLVAWVALTAARQPVSGLSDFGQGLLGIASLIALLAGGWLYFLEGRNRARHDVSAVASIVPLAPEPDGGGLILVQLVGTLTNRGAFPATYECVGVDVRGFSAEQAPKPHPNFLYDVLTHPIRAAPRGRPQWRRCMEVEKRRWEKRRWRDLKRLGLPGHPAPFQEPDSGLRYGEMQLEAGESRTVDYEAVVVCREFVAVRLHFMVPKPGTDSAPEAKAVLSILDACAASRQLKGGKGPPMPPSPTRVEFEASG